MSEESNQNILTEARAKMFLYHNQFGMPNAVILMSDLYEILNPQPEDADTPMMAITLKEFERLTERDVFLSALEQSGVDNWSGFEYAHDIVDHGEDKDESV